MTLEQFQYDSAALLEAFDTGDISYEEYCQRYDDLVEACEGYA